MGYGVTITLNDVIIPKDKVQACLNAINSMNDGTHYSWVESKKGQIYPNIEVAFNCWRYDVEVLESGDVQVVDFLGENLGDEDILWRQIAPFVSGEIICWGEDSNHWKWYFENDMLCEKVGCIVYEF